MRTTALIDADILAYKIASKSESRVRWPGADEVSIAVDEWEEVHPRVSVMVREWTEAAGCDTAIICLSDSAENGFRRHILPSYKMNRADTVRPLLLQEIKGFLFTNFPSCRKPTLEADDVMGILSTHPKLVPGKKVIVSDDKDMKTIPGWLYSPMAGRKPRKIEEDEADWWHMHQTLTGDRTDGYVGCPGIGKARADKILAATFPPSPLGLWEAVLDQYIRKGISEQEALIQAQVARICRSTDYDFKSQRVKLWQPPEE